MYLRREGNVGAQSYLYLQTEQQPTTAQPSMACAQGQLFECQRSIRELWPNPTGSSVEAHVHPHTDKLACSSLGEPMPCHPFAVQPFFGTCKDDSVALVQFQSSREPIPTSQAVSTSVSPQCCCGVQEKQEERPGGCVDDLTLKITLKKYNNNNNNNKIFPLAQPQHCWNVLFTHIERR